MSKRVFLVRHAEAADKTDGQSDRERTLTAAGRKNTLRLAEELHRLHQTPEILWTSNAARAVETADLIASTLLQLKPITVAELYDESVRSIVSMLGNVTDTAASIMLVGHNPTLSMLANYLCKDFQESLSPASSVGFTFDIDSWREITGGIGVMANYIDPRLLSTSK